MKDFFYSDIDYHFFCCSCSICCSFLFKNFILNEPVPSSTLLRKGVRCVALSDGVCLVSVVNLIIKSEFFPRLLLLLLVI